MWSKNVECLGSKLEFLQTKLPNDVVDLLTLLLRILEVPGSNLGPETYCPDWGFSSFS
jgi:hypothetical protein